MIKPLSWKRPRKIFVNSMSDLFHESLPDETIDTVFAVMALSPQHIFQVLTKRPERSRAYLTARNGMGNASLCRAINEIPAELGNRHGALEMPLPNVWLGVSVEDQQRADDRVPLLLRTPAAKRFLSCEPLLGPIDLARWLAIDWQCSFCQHFFTGKHKPVCPSCGKEGGWSGSHRFNGRGFARNGAVPVQRGKGIDWVICGGESGPGARPLAPAWARSLRDQCNAAGVAYFFKQWGEWGMPTDSLSALDWPYHPNHDRTHWFDRRRCIRPIESSWSDKYKDGIGAFSPPPFDLFQTPEYLDQVARCPQETCRIARKCEGNSARAAVTRVGKKAAGRLLDGRTWDEVPA